jgi:UPF0755 protein
MTPNDSKPTLPQQSEVPVLPAEQPPTTKPIRLLQRIHNQPTGLLRHKPTRKQKKLIIAASIFAGLIIACAAMVIWYTIQLTASGTDTSKYVLVSIAPGTTPTKIGEQLQSQSVIRSSFAFDIYTRLSNQRDNLQAGTYRLSSSESTQTIVEHLVKGDIDGFSLTFYPGATLVQDKKVLLDAGYSAANIDSAFAATYNSPLFADKPASSNLEGYIFGQTYKFNAGATVPEILERTFAEYYNALTTDTNIIAGMKTQGLNLYQGITLASIIQKEMTSPSGLEPTSDQRQVAQVFYSRLADDMTLGSDVTFQYAAIIMSQPVLLSIHHTIRAFTLVCLLDPFQTLV